MWFDAIKTFLRMKALFLAVRRYKVLVHYECNACRLASLLLQRLYFYCRLEAPRYRRVSPANGEPQRLIITKEVCGNIHNLLQTNCVLPEAVIGSVYKSDIFEYYHGNHSVCNKCVFFCADSSRATLCCGSSVEEYHLHTGAI